MDRLKEIQREIEDRAEAIRSGEIVPIERLPDETDEGYLGRVAEVRRAEMGIDAKEPA